MKHFCILPWVHVRIETTGNVFPCCRITDLYSYGNLKEKTLDEIWNDTAIREMRLGLLNDQALPQCQGCLKSEQPNLPPSYRQMHNKTFASAFDRVVKTKEDGSLDSTELLFLDLRFSNLCNFRCRSCFPDLSSAWYGDSKKLDPDFSLKEINRPTRTREELWALIDSQIPHLRAIYFAGGEPLLEEDHYILLEKLIAQGRTDITLSYNTNLSTLSFKKWNVLELWPKFRKIFVGVSFDGIGAQAEFLRKGSNWTKLEQNFESIREIIPRQEILISPTVSAMNAFHIPAAIDRWIELGWLQEKDDFRFNIATRPEKINLNILSLKERATLRAHYHDYLVSLRSRGLSELLVNKIEAQLEYVLISFSDKVWEIQRAEFRDWTRKLDKIRGENFVNLFPELRDIFASAESNRVAL